MMQWFFWSIGMSAIISAAGLLTERVVRAARQPVRMIWVIALLASFAVPLYAVYHATNKADSARIDRVISQARMIDAPLPASPKQLPPAEPQLISSGDVRRPDFVPAITLVLLIVLFAAMPIGMLYEYVTLRRDRRDWREDVVDGYAVLVSPSFGPAIVGVIHPRIVMPSWSLSLPDEERSLLLAHELEHIRLHDSRLLLCGMFLLMLTPWNLAAWWQLSRLRLAIELDCDARVLRMRPGAAQYGRLLIDVTGRAVGARLAVTAFAERRSSLRSRLEFMTPSARDLSVPLACGAAVAALVLLGCAKYAPRPSAPAPVAFKQTSNAPLELAVGDSIVALRGNRVLRAAVNLPAHFDIEYMTRASDRGGAPSARCGQYLRDPRDNTRLQLVQSEGFTNSVNRADTVVTTSRALGYYRILDGLHYGLSSSDGYDATLRVGCSEVTRVTVGGRPYGVHVTTLDTPGDDRARTLASTISAELAQRPDSLELRPHRVHLVFSGGEMAAVTDYARYEREFSAARIVWRDFGRDAGTDTVTVSFHKKTAPGTSWVATASFYPEQLAGKH